MTREEARIKLIEIRAQLEVILSMYGLEISDVFDIAIKALSAESCDCISRAEVMKLSQHKPEYGDMIYAFDVSILPSVKPVACIGKVEFDEEKLKDIVHETIENYSRPKGEWIGNENGRCSVCGHEGCGSDIFSGCKDGMYCPNCGADVRGEE